MKQKTSNEQAWEYIGKIVRKFPLGILMMIFCAIISAIDISVRPYLLKVIVDCASKVDVSNIFSDVAIPAMLFVGLNFLKSVVTRFCFHR